MRSLSTLLRYVLVTILVAAAILFALLGLAAGKAPSVSSLLGGLPLLGVGAEHPPPRLGPILNIELEPHVRYCPEKHPLPIGAPAARQWD